MADIKLKRDQYCVLKAWMIEELGLKGGELITYAIIYGFSQEEGCEYTGSLAYLAKWTGGTKRSVITWLQSLTEKGFIIKRDRTMNGVRFCSYSASNFTTGEKISLGGGEKISPNNIDINNLGIEESITPTLKSSRNTRENLSVGEQRVNRFTPPTLDEVRAYCKERYNRVDPEAFMDFYTSNGWKVGKNPMRDWKAAIRTWERSERTTTKKREPEVNWA